jgi:signal transduction histidine kinase
VPGGKSELVRLVNTINDSFDRLHRAFEMQKVFVANASHELRTPLTALRGELELALYKERSIEEYRQYLSTAYDSSKRISNLVTHLLLFAKTQGDQQSTHTMPLRIDEVLMEVIEQIMAGNPNSKIEVRFNDDQPNESRLLLKGNENLLSFAFSNIIENSIKFSGNAPVLVEIETEPKVVIRIKDKGIGISLTDLDHVFEPFYRSKRSSETDGFGLGLPLAQQIFRIHGAEIHLKSKLMEGTLVTISWQAL